MSFGNLNFPVDFAIDDFNNDGRLDLAVPNQDTMDTVSIFLGDGLGGFTQFTDVQIS